MSGAGTMVTPLVLTWNEEVNIARTLEALRWANRVVVLDSGSTDGTEPVARAFSNVDWQTRRFDAHGAQWEYGVRETGISTPYVLALDADMVVNAPFVAEMEREVLIPGLDGGELSFRMVLDGQALWGDIYPAQLRLFRAEKVSVGQRGHTQVFTCAGSCYKFQTRIDHEDSKGCEQWLRAQLRYSELEAMRIRNSGDGSLKDRLRRWGVMPIVSGLLGYLTAGGPLTGGAARRYGMERAAFEMMLALRLLRDDAERRTPR